MNNHKYTSAKHMLAVLEAAEENEIMTCDTAKSIADNFDKLCTLLEDEESATPLIIDYFRQEKENMFVELPSGAIYDACGEFYTIDDWRKADSDTRLVNCHTLLIDADLEVYNVFMKID